MNLSKDQKKLIKFFSFYTPVTILAYGVIGLIRRDFSWAGFLGYATGIVIVGIFMTVFYVAGSHVPRNKK